MLVTCCWSPIAGYAQVRSLKKLIFRREGFNDEGQQAGDIPSWVPGWGILFYQLWVQLRNRIVVLAVRAYNALLRFSRSQTLDDISTSVVGINVFFMTLPHTYDSAFGQVRKR